MKLHRLGFYVISYAVILFLLGVASDKAQAKSAILGDRTLTIPARYFTSSDSIPIWLRWLPGVESGSRELLLTIKGPEVANAVPGYKANDGDYSDDIRIRLAVLTDQDRRRYLDPKQFLDIWDRTGSYRNEIVSVDSATGHYRVYRRTEYPLSWEEFTISPDSPMPEDVAAFSVAHCIDSKSPLTTSGQLPLCKSFVIVKDVALNYTISAQNLALNTRIRKYLRSLLANWLD